MDRKKRKQLSIKHVAKLDVSRTKIYLDTSIQPDMFYETEEYF
jgi:hypothetical protein